MRACVGSFADLLRLMEENAKLTVERSCYAALVAQVALSDTFAFYAPPRFPGDDHTLVAVAGVYPFGVDAAELWFLESDQHLSRNIIPFVRATREALEFLRGKYHGGIMCLIHPETMSGKRLARLLGFEPSGVIFNQCEEWCMTDPNMNKGLPVAGYTDQPNEAVECVNANKMMEEELLQRLESIADEFDVDKRWLAIARTSFEQGFMALNRSIFKPQRVTITGD